MREGDHGVLLVDSHHRRPDGDWLLRAGAVVEIVTVFPLAVDVRPIDDHRLVFVDIEDIRVLSSLELLARQAE